MKIEFKNNSNKRVSFKTSNNLKKTLPNPNYRFDENEKSGIYEINYNACNYFKCKSNIRKVKLRFKERFLLLKFNRMEKLLLPNIAFRLDTTL